MAPSSACDVCSIFLGVQPNGRRNTIGLFYRSRFMEGSTQIPETSYLIPKHGSHVPVGVASRTVPMVETVNVAELRADLRLSDRVFLLASLPLTNTYRSVNNYQVLDAYGMGDDFAMVRYQMVNTRCDEREPLFIHRFLVGAGVKIPLGRNHLRIDDELVSPDVQLGTGSWDGLASLYCQHFRCRPFPCCFPVGSSQRSVVEDDYSPASRILFDDKPTSKTKTQSQ